MTGTLLWRHSSPLCCWSLWWISANLITMRCSTLRSTFCSLITLATPRQDLTGSNPSRREGVGCGFTLSRSHSCCAVRLVYIQISPGHIWTTLYMRVCLCIVYGLRAVSLLTRVCMFWRVGSRHRKRMLSLIEHVAINFVDLSLGSWMSVRIAF